MTSYKFGYWLDVRVKGPERSGAASQEAASLRGRINQIVDDRFEVEMEVPECGGVWLRLFLSASNLSEAHASAAVGCELIKHMADAELALELEHISEFDEDGCEVRRYNPDGSEIEPDCVHPKFGNWYTLPLRPSRIH